MNSPNDDSISILNGLALVNSERVISYKKVLQLLNADISSGKKNLKIRSIINNSLGDTAEYANTLENIVLIEGGKKSQDGTVNAKLLELANKIDSLFSGLFKKNILAACEACEDLVQRAYEFALDQPLWEGPCKIVKEQQTTLQNYLADLKALNNNLAPAISGQENEPGNNLRTLNQPDEPIFMAAG